MDERWGERGESNPDKGAVGKEKLVLGIRLSPALHGSIFFHEEHVCSLE